MSTQGRPPTSTARTVTQEESLPDAGPSNASPERPPAGVLKLRGGPLKKQRVVWSEETVDNEGMGKKKSKICCIYHKPRAFDESSSDESSSCGSSDDGGPSRSGDNRHAHRNDGQGQRKRQEGGGEEVCSNSSESEGDGGDSRARPAHKPKRKGHQHGKGCDHGRDKMNKYDVQPKSEGGGNQANGSG
ncbi:hypothetical protein I317_04289 [Kwoniella heveanensis CBS 569]|nr:hypothetical protein I317_04289 [Kwoniella heveanensis CBS 569]